jgi:6-pyruvoyl-tetrahydropterin synthase
MMANVKNVHGHSYKLSVTVMESIENRDNVKFGMVIDFTDEENCKEEIVDQFDRYRFNETTPHVELAHRIRTGSCYFW